MHSDQSTTHRRAPLRAESAADATHDHPISPATRAESAADATHDHPKEECGVFGVSTPHGDGLAQTVFFGLFALQHRGQEAAGIAVSDGRRVRLHKDSGLVANVFTPATMATLSGYHGIGHTRYSTTGANAQRNIQPFLVETMHGPLALAHNGNLVNSAALREELLARGFGLTATSDTEVLTLMLAAAGGKTWEDRLERTLPAWKGAYSMVMLAADRVIAARDPWGFRPMSVGRLPHGGYAVASETCALTTLGCVDIDEVQPGEIITLQGAEIHRRTALSPATRSARCTFEFVYFSRPDSVWAGRNIHQVRQRLGEELARESAVDADVVIPVPDSSIPAAIGYSRASGIDHNDGLIKNRYIGRTFIEPTQDLRERGVALKFNALAENLDGRRVIMIDDSLVRGTTAGPLVKLLRDAGAREVHVRITCPPITHACHFGVDMGHDGDLMASRLTVDEMRGLIGADTLAFLSLEGMMRAINADGDGREDGYCNACFTGRYPIAVSEAAAKLSFEGAIA
jgi:amidophosphoribosyltransferase